jgi:hypothetical protein
MLDRMCPKGGKKNASGEIIKGSNLKNLIQNRPDFMQELTMLQWVGKQCRLLFLSPQVRSTGEMGYYDS